LNKSLTALSGVISLETIVVSIMGNAGWVPNLLMYPLGLQDEVCGVAGGFCSDRRGSQVLMFATNAQSNRTSPLDRQITTPENQASAEFESTNPLEQGLGGRFFWDFVDG
jgi:hypothetical protein